MRKNEVKCHSDFLLGWENSIIMRRIFIQPSHNLKILFALPFENTQWFFPKHVRLKSNGHQNHEIPMKGGMVNRNCFVGGVSWSRLIILLRFILRLLYLLCSWLTHSVTQCYLMRILFHFWKQSVVLFFAVVRASRKRLTLGGAIETPPPSILRLESTLHAISVLLRAVHDEKTYFWSM